jgi:hypothetical protein
MTEWRCVVYRDPDEFALGIVTEQMRGWQLHSWQDTGSGDGWWILAVFNRQPS